MISKEEISEIREHLQGAVSPLFYFDNDQDGSRSYLLLRRMIGKGAGIPVKTSPLNENYYRRIREFEPDCVFILDQPTVDNDFFEKLHNEGIKIVWIDHHENIIEEIPSYVHYYNPLYSGERINEPVTSVCYEISKKKEDVWLAVVGCIADRFMPDFYFDFFEKFPDLGKNAEDPFDVFYNSEIGKISRMIGTGLKDRTTNVVKMLRFLSNVKNPYEVLEETRENHTMHKRFEMINTRFEKLIEKAKENVDSSNLLVFRYSGETSMSADLANKLSYLYPDKYLLVAYIKGVRVNVSMRGKDVKEKAFLAIKEFPHATCGGHNDAVGAQMDVDELDKFVENLKKGLSLI